MRRTKGAGSSKSGRLNQPAGGFVALGAGKEAGRPDAPKAEPRAEARPDTATKRGLDRDAAQEGPGTKAVRLDSASSAGPSPSVSLDLLEDSEWLALATHPVAPTALLHKVESAEEKLKTTRVPKILCSVAKELGEKREAEPDPALASGLAYLARAKAPYFQEKEVTAAFASLLRPRARPANPVLLDLVANLLATAFSGVSEWPLLFLKLYLEDSLGERAWVEREEAAAFVRGLQTAFPVVLPTPQHIVLLLGAEEGGKGGGGGASPNVKASVSSDGPSADSEITGIISLADAADEDPGMDLLSALEGSAVETVETPRFGPAAKQQAEALALALLRDAWARQSGPNAAAASPALLKTMAGLIGLSEVRLAAVGKLEGWLGTGKVQRAALGLLASLCLNLGQPLDQEMLGNLAKLRSLKSKAVLPVFAACLREVMGRDSAALASVVRVAVLNEISSTRGPNNMYILQQAFGSAVERAEAGRVLGELFAELLLSGGKPEEALRPLRGFFRELVRSVLRCDFPLLAFVGGLTEAGALEGAGRLGAARERLLDAICDLLCLGLFLRHSTAIRDAATTKKGVEQSGLLAFLEEVRQVKELGLRWLASRALHLFAPTSEQFMRALWQVLFIEKAEWYSGKDSWPSDAERNLILRTIGEAGLSEASLGVLLDMGLEGRVPLLPSASLDVCESIVRKAAAASVPGGCPLEVLEPELINRLLHSATYCPPASIALPADYAPPMVAVGNLFWKAWAILLIVGARNPATIGRKVWHTYPTARLLMEMCIIGDFAWPPQTATTEQTTADDLVSRDLQEREREKAGIIQLEDFLAKASDPAARIDEQNSHLLPLLVGLEPKGPARRPPAEFLASLASLDGSLSLGRRLCQSREPDFLLELLSRSSSTLAQPWLVRLMQSKDEGSIAVLPVQCLCEFLIHQMGSGDSEDSRQELQARLHHVVWTADESGGDGQLALTYFLQRLASPDQPERDFPHNLLPNLLRSYPDDPPFHWLHDRIPSLPFFPRLRPTLESVLRKALVVETQADRLVAFLRFLSSKGTGKGAAALSVGMLVTSRPMCADLVFPQRGEWDGQRQELLQDLLQLLRSGAKEALEAAWAKAGAEPLVVSLQWGSEAAVESVVEVGQAALCLASLWRGKGDDRGLLRQASELRIEPLVESEKTELLPESVRLHLLASGAEWAAKRALEGASEESLLRFVAKGALPPSSAAAVLEALDGAHQRALESLLAALTPGALRRLCAVAKAQKLRCHGDKSGAKFIRLLDSVVGKKDEPSSSASEPMDAVDQPKPAPKPVDWDKELKSTAKKNPQLKARLDRIKGKQGAKAKEEPYLAKKEEPVTVASLKRDWSLEQRRKKLEKVVAVLEEIRTKNEPSKASRATASAAARRWGELDPEVIHLLPARSLELILSRRGFPAQQSLTSLLLHQSSTEVLRSLIDQLLKQRRDEFSPTLVLGLLEEFLRLPRLQFVKDRSVSRYAQREDLLGLSRAQVCVAFDYVAAESSELPEKTKADERSKILQGRMELMEALIADDKARLSAALRHLADRKEISEEAAQLFRQLSFRHPLHELSCVGQPAEVEGSWTGLDKVLFEAVTELFRLGGAERSEKEGLERAAAALHAWAAEQPRLVARQLPLVSALLRGTTSLFMRTYAQTNLLALFHHLLRLLHSLTAQAMEEPVRPALLDILASFLDFVKNACLRSTRLVDFVRQVLSLVEEMYRLEPQVTSEALEAEWEVLEACAVRYPDTGRSLRALLALPFAPAAPGPSTDAAEDASASSAGVSVQNLAPFYSRPEPPLELGSVNQLVGRLSRAAESGSLEELESTLAEAEARTGGAGEARQGGGRLVGWLLGSLLPLLQSPGQGVRESAVRLIVRYLEQRPDHWALLQPALTAALAGSDTAAAASLRGSLASLAALRLDGAPQLLRSAVAAPSAPLHDPQTRAALTAALNPPIPN